MRVSNTRTDTGGRGQGCGELERLKRLKAEIGGADPRIVLILDTLAPTGKRDRG